MKTEVYICVLCACLVTLAAQKTSAMNEDPNDFTFLSYSTTQGSEVQGPSSNVLVNGSEQMTNHSSVVEKVNKNLLEWIILPKPAENEWPLNETQDIAQV